MQKNRVPSIKTADFAKLCNTTKRTLIHYDEIGLFSPALTDSRGYRFYSETQCDVFYTITCLKELGMPLLAIRDFIHSRTPESLKEILLIQEQKIQQEISHLQKMQNLVQTKLSLVETRSHLNFTTSRLLPVELVFMPEEYMILSAPLYTNEHLKILHTLYDHIAFCNENSYISGHPYGSIHETKSIQKGERDSYAYFMTKVSVLPKDLALLNSYTKPAGRYAMTYLLGDYYDADEAFELLLSFFTNQKLTPGPYIFKEAIIDETASCNQADYVTRISVQILD